MWDCIQGKYLPSGNVYSHKHTDSHFLPGLLLSPGGWGKQQDLWLQASVLKAYKDNGRSTLWLTMLQTHTHTTSLGLGVEKNILSLEQHSSSSKAEWECGAVTMALTGCKPGTSHWLMSQFIILTHWPIAWQVTHTHNPDLPRVMSTVSYYRIIS